MAIDFGNDNEPFMTAATLIAYDIPEAGLVIAPLEWANRKPAVSDSICGSVNGGERWSSASRRATSWVGEYNSNSSRWASMTDEHCVSASGGGQHQ
jgi:hypothetical protein